MKHINAIEYDCVFDNTTAAVVIFISVVWYNLFDYIIYYMENDARFNKMKRQVQ